MQALNIQIYVDVVQLLLDQDAAHAAFLFDDSPCGGDGQGTARLRSPVLPGQLVRWTVTPVDVQTPIWISRIEFMPKAANLDPEATGAADDAQSAAEPSSGDMLATETDTSDPAPWVPPVWARSWNGFVPAWDLTCGGEYAYRLVFSFAGAREIAMEGPALVYPAVATSDPEFAPEGPAAATKEA